MPDPFANDSVETQAPGLVLPDAPALLALRGRSRGHVAALAVSADGEIEELGVEAALGLLEHEAVIVVHGGFTARRIAGSQHDRQSGAP